MNLPPSAQMRWLTRAAARAALGLSGVCLPALANPQGMSVAAGAASTASSGSTLTVTTSPRAVLNWQSFNIGSGEKTVFNQPSPGSIVWNQINDPNPSKIFGSLQANGVIVLASPSGFWFGPNSVVKAASFVATTAYAPPPDFAGGGPWTLNIAPPSASIINYGSLESAKGGSLFLLAEKVENHGVLTAPDGTLGLYAGKQVLVSERPDGRGLSAQVSLPAGSVDNFGKLIADAGQIALNAQVVNQSGVVKANGLAMRNGVVELVATDDVTLGPGSETLAQGDASAPGDGGRITIKSGGTYHDAPTARVSAAASPKGGDGGGVELSADNLGSILAKVDASGFLGGRSGSLLLDPNTITIDNGGTGNPNGGIIGVNAPGSPTIDPASLTAFTTISLEAKTSITVNAPITLPDGPEKASYSITLRSGGNITFGARGGIAAGMDWAVNLIAGATFAGPTDVKSGTGSVALNGGATISSVDHAVSIYAGKDVTVQTGAIRTTGGGSISVTALGGSINAGTSPVGFNFGLADTGYSVSQNVGGISTAAGGDVALSAGKDVTSLLPTLTSNASSGTDAGSGVFGSQGGNLTITAGGNVYGHYVEANGAGKIAATGSAGTAQRLLALSLISGSWTVAANSIALQEVRNPQGVYNPGVDSSDPLQHKFDYAPDASVTLMAATSVTLAGTALPRVAGASVPIIYPGTLKITSGSGGIGIGSSVILFPEPDGQLVLDTGATGGGLFSTTAGRSASITMSDSASSSYTAQPGEFLLNDHASTPVHLADSTPAKISISGDLTSINLNLAKATILTVGGNMTDSSLVTQNLSQADQTCVTVGGKISSANSYTFYTLPAGVMAPDFSLLFSGTPPVVASVALSYDPKNNVVAARGPMSSAQLAGLLNLQVQEFDNFGNPVLDQHGSPVFTPYQILPPDFLQQIYAGSQNSAVTANAGIQVGGPGKLKVNASSIDLGLSQGIVSSGAGLNPALGKYTPRGASVSVDASTGDISMFSSAIISEAGGDISVKADQGAVNVGSTFVIPESGTARGIYTTAGGSVAVTAHGSVEINGSRIATYDGGKLSVLSETGSVDAGTGGLSLQSVVQFLTDSSGKLIANRDIIPGNGILATTFTYGDAKVGDITVDAPQGDIVARSGGIIQAPFNGTSGKSATIDLTAGSPGYKGKIDASGSVVAGGNVEINATGDILGFFLASGNLGINTPQAVSVTALAGGNATVSAGGSVSGTIIGVGGVSASGSAINANLVSQNVSTTGGQATGQVGLGTGNVAAAAGQAAAANNAAPTERKVASADTEDENNKKRRPVLTRTTGRVTVMLPGKAN
jgi:trimeric autotransporter adhesin